MIERGIGDLPCIINLFRTVQRMLMKGGLTGMSSLPVNSQSTIALRRACAVLHIHLVRIRQPIFAEEIVFPRRVVGEMKTVMLRERKTVPLEYFVRLLCQICRG